MSAPSTTPSAKIAPTMVVPVLRAVGPLYPLLAKNAFLKIMEHEHVKYHLKDLSEKVCVKFTPVYDQFVIPSGYRMVG